ncbi:uncharacterized protein LOC134811979 [Bolinopsis microptera]|uniref:uncharacterized protein LOC134811979 n=1 Tax=Bolinopsis microptera TaxID=2820187 RepID=UPI003079DE45
MFVALVFLIGTVGAGSTSEECPRILDAAGISKMFAPMVAHSIHSLTLEDIRYFFKEDATEDNGVPTVNIDLMSDTRILPNAPLAGYDEDFSTQSMKTFDLVMRNMNRTWWGITNFNTLDKLTHAFHMAEVWDSAAEQYRLVKRLLDPESDICGCATNVAENDILNYLNLMAFKIKYPGITSGNKTLTDHYLESRERRSADFDLYDIESRYHMRYTLTLSGEGSQADFDGIDFDLSDIELQKDIAEKLVDDEGVVTEHADSAEHWEVWRKMVKHGMEESGYYDLAVFMFCMLN